MRFFRSFVYLSFFIPTLCSAQQPIKRDAQAVAVLTQSLAAMGGTVPADSTAIGKITLTEGSKIQTGTIRILTRGTDESFDEIQTADERRAIRYSRGSSKEAAGDIEKRSSLEWAASAQSIEFPLVLSAAALSNHETALQYIGSEQIEGRGQAHHVRWWRTFESNPKLKPLAEFTVRDLWIDTKTALPVKLSFTRRRARGADVSVSVEVCYSDFRNISGLLYPFLIEKSRNGTPWLARFCP